ncbi:hypothetical protein NQ314_011299 [Rhamnusium bicolor]|uniref:Uncharacterized protein n=1 Tax=Rhamnusium bicolor TaxID=1586634 RepID=A0AAV8XJ34_9CUCU|nr:hypothetical protein NQ314_011299 [Rhamnusium bicolor]
MFALHLSDTKEILTYKVYLLSLQSLLSFITDCLIVGEESENMDETVKSQLKLNDIKVFEMKHEVDDDSIAIKEEYDECKENFTVKDEDVLELGNSRAAYQK